MDRPLRPPPWQLTPDEEAAINERTARSNKKDWRNTTIALVGCAILLAAILTNWAAPLFTP